MPNDEFVTFEVKGLDDFQRKLEVLPQKVAQKGLRRAVRAGATVLKNAMAALVDKETGFESEHIDIRTRLTRGELAITAFIGPNNKIIRPERVGKVSRKGKAWRQWTARMVAKFLEFGTSRHSKKPFMTQAAESYKDAAVEAVTESLKQTFEDLE